MKNDLNGQDNSSDQPDSSVRDESLIPEHIVPEAVVPAMTQGRLDEPTIIPEPVVPPIQDDSLTTDDTGSGNIEPTVMAEGHKESPVPTVLPLEMLPTVASDDTTPESSAPDPFDPELLRVSADMAEVGIKKVITTVPCRKPGKQEFVRTRAGEGNSLNTLILEDQETRDCYLVAPGLREYVLQDSVMVRLTMAVTRSGDLFLWPLKLPGPDGRSCRWHESALVAAQRAETSWVRVAANMSSGCYDVYEAQGIKLEPEWPELSFRELLRLCFKDRLIDSPDHPFLKRLRGEV